jgi:starvation-inducible DNA-binding protein
MKLLCTYLAFIRFLANLHQTFHWQSNGVQFYALHLMFERLYNETVEEIDGVAEKIAGTFSADLLNINEQTALIQIITNKYCNSNIENLNILQTALEAEEDFIKLSKSVYDKMKEESSLTLGWDDLIMSISNTHESHVYLLKQTLLNQLNRTV